MFITLILSALTTQGNIQTKTAATEPVTCIELSCCSFVLSDRYEHLLKSMYPYVWLIVERSMIEIIY